MTAYTMKSASPLDAATLLGQAVARIRESYARRERKRRDHLWLKSLADCQLRDIGLARSQIRAAVYGGSPA